MVRQFALLGLTGCLLLAPLASLRAEDPRPVDRRVYEQTVAKAIAFLRNQAREDEGSFSGFAGMGPTALVTTSLLSHGVPPTDPLVARSLKYVESHARDDGGIYQEGTLYRNYETSLAILCLAKANKDGKYDKLIAKADAFVKGLQWAEDEDLDASDPGFGGGGYGKHKRPDLSNTTFLIDALRAAGNSADSEAIQRALVFVSRCQNLESEHNQTPFSTKVNDGGFYYTPAAGGTSQAGKTANGGLRSYGSMTYAGLKSMIFAGVSSDDQRVQAAVEWIKRNYDLKSNPGMGDAGLFYYYHTFAKSLDALEQETLTDSSGTIHSWRAELVDELAGRQRTDGSWVNKNERWMEGDANLSTAYSLLALSYCKPGK